ncbi:MAG: hypothetical protein ACXVIY_02960 [Mucilaginibacter sp.]
MKKIITITAIILAAGTSVFAAPGKSKAPKAKPTVSFTAVQNDNAFGVKAEAEKTVVIIYDQDGNGIYKDVVTNGLPTEKSYNVSGLDTGDYTVEIKSEKSDVKTQMHVYDNGQGKSYLFVQ